MSSARVLRIADRFRGPPNSGNGGYVAGLTAAGLGGAAMVRLSAPIPVEEDLELTEDDAGRCLRSRSGQVLAQARIAEPLEAPPPAPDPDEAEAAGRRFPGLRQVFHPVCFTCSPHLAEDVGLRVFVGDLHPGEKTEGTAPYDPCLGLSGRPLVAGLWRPDAAFADEAGRLGTEMIWAALDCPGSVAWSQSGGGAGLLGSITVEILSRPMVEQDVLVIGWGVEQSGRKRLSGTAMFTRAGALLAQSRQVWITPAAASW